MVKRLALVLALAMVVGIAGAAFAEVQNVKVSGNIDTYGFATTRFDAQNDNLTDVKRYNGLISIVGVRVDADLTDNVSTTVKLLSERLWGTEDATDDGMDINLALGYVTLKEFLYSPLTLTIGRQDLRYGNGMIIGDVNTNRATSSESQLTGTQMAGLSQLKAFDAIKAVLNYDPLTIDIIASKIDGDDNEAGLALEDDQDLYGINANYKLNQNTTLEGYYFARYTQTNASGSTPQKADAVYVYGGRIGSVVPRENLDINWGLEAALQSGKYDDGTGNAKDRMAYAGEAYVTAGMKKWKWSPSFTLLGAYFTGKKEPGTATEIDGTTHGWDPMFEDQKFGDIANTVFPQSNVRILGAVTDLKLTEDVALKGEAYWFWFDRLYGASDLTSFGTYDTYTMDAEERYAGMELDCTATYNYTEDVQFALMGGMLFPGDAFDNSNDSVATELIGSMKVTF